MYNKVVLIGNLGKDPESKTLEGGTVVSRCTVATSENYKDKDGEWKTLTEWHNVVIWKKLPESIKKGSMVFVEGSVKTRSYKDKDGVDKYTTEINAQILRGLEKAPASKAPGAAPIEGAAPPQTESAPAFDDNDDLPF
jgi:single-strand DNA-binding protein